MFKLELKSAFQKLLNEFFMEERGNRLTSNNLEGLSLKIGLLFNQFEVKEKEDGKQDEDNK